MKRLGEVSIFSIAAALVLGSAVPPSARADASATPAPPSGMTSPPSLPVQRSDRTGPVPPVASVTSDLPEDAPALEGEPRWSQLNEVVAAAETAAAPSPGSPRAVEPAQVRGGVRVVISIPQQKAYVFRGGELFGTSPVSTGKRGHPTPVGTFPILQKEVHHRSNIYANAPMPYMQRLTHYGIALHAGHLPGYPASHGCIRLPRSFAKKLYDITSHGTRVTITNKRPKSAEDALRLA